MKPLAYFLLIASVVFCAAGKAKLRADRIFYNARVVCVDSAWSVQEAFAVKDGKFLDVGSTKYILETYDAAEKTDLQQHFVYPGFIDAHCHFWGYAGDLYKCQLVGTRSFEEVLEKVNAYASESKSGFIYGRGWDQNDWDVKEFPDNKKLNAMFPETPVFLKRIDGHAVLVNEAFFRLAAEELKPYMHSEFVELKNGVPTGILFDIAMDAAESKIPALSADEMTRELLQAQRDCYRLGLTSVADAGLSPQNIQMLDSLQKKGTLSMRIYAMVSATDENLKYLEKKGPYKTPYLSVRSIKIYADGALGSRGALLKQPYSDQPMHRGSFNTTPEVMQRYAQWAGQHQFQVNTHAIGDSGNAMVLKIYADVLKGKNDLRWRIEHAQVVDPADWHFFGDFSIIPSVQPTHATSDMYWAEKRLGAERMPGAYAYESLRKQNGWLPLGTDFPVEYLNPQYTFYAAVSRQDAAGFPVNGFNKPEALSRMDALKGMTIWAAKGQFEENEKGSIEKGKWADFVVYDLDLIHDDLLKIRNSTPAETYSAGKQVYKKP